MPAIGTCGRILARGTPHASGGWAGGAPVRPAATWRDAPPRFSGSCGTVTPRIHSTASGLTTGPTQPSTRESSGLEHRAGQADRGELQGAGPARQDACRRKRHPVHLRRAWTLRRPDREGIPGGRAAAGGSARGADAPPKREMPDGLCNAIVQKARENESAAEIVTQILFGIAAVLSPVLSRPRATRSANA